jgi:hypothetical protein
MYRHVGQAIVRDLVVEHLNGIDNVVNLEMNAHAKYDKIEWAIQANEDHGKVRI